MTSKLVILTLSAVKIKEQGLAPVPRLSFVNIIFPTPGKGGLSSLPN